MLPLQFVAVEVFIIAYILGALTQNWLLSTGICSTLLYAVFYASDFFALPTETDIYYHIWLFAVAVAAGLAGHIYSYAMQCKQLIRFNFHKGKDAEGKRNTAVPIGDVAAFLLFASAIATTAGINLWTERTVIGVSPIGTLHETAGIALTLTGGFVLIATSIAMMIMEVRVRITVKYFWMFVDLMIGFLITDYGYYHYEWASGVPELLGAAVFFGMTVLVILGATYLPVRHNREDKYGKKKPTSSDIFFHKRNYAIVFFGGIALTVIVAIVAFILIISWPEKSLAAGAYLLLAVAGLSVVLSFTIFLLLPDKISSLRSASEVVKVSKMQIYQGSQGSRTLFNMSESNESDD